MKEILALEDIFRKSEKIVPKFPLQLPIFKCEFSIQLTEWKSLLAQKGITCYV